MSVRLRLGPFSISSRGRAGVRMGPVSVYGGGRRRRRRSASNTRRTSQASQIPSTTSPRQSDPVHLEAWLKSPPPQLKLPGRFTQNWFTENAANIHPGQVETLKRELISRGWSQDDIDRRAVPHLTRAALDRQFLIQRHQQALLRVAARKQARSDRWRAFSTTPSRIWRRLFGRNV
jgi:hypothetical protein